MRGIWIDYTLLTHIINVVSIGIHVVHISQYIVTNLSGIALRHVIFISK